MGWGDAKARLITIREDVKTILELIGITNMVSQYDEDRQSISRQGGGYQFRADISGSYEESNVLYAVADIEISIFWFENYASLEKFKIEVHWDIQEVIMDPNWWRQSGGVFSIDEAPTIIDALDFQDAIYGWTMGVRVILRP